MESGSNKNVENTVKRVCHDQLVPKVKTSKKMSTLTNSPTSLNVPPEIKKNCGDKQVEITIERIKMAKNTKEKQNSDLEKVAFKRKAEGEEKPAAKKEAKTIELDNQLVSMPLPQIPLKNVMDVEMKLVYIDEEDVRYEFVEPFMATGIQPTCPAAEIVDPLSGPNFSSLPQIDKWLQVALKDASTCYRQKKYTVAAGQFRTALELCSKGAALGKPFDAPADHVASVASFIETKLVNCYLRMRKPDLALNHAHRSIVLNPAYFRNHLRQATVFRCLERYSEAARSAMIADYMFWLCGGSEQCISKLIKLYWQAMIEEAITRTESFSVMYTPFATKIRADKIEKVKEVFTKTHPAYAEYIYTDLCGLHVLPQTADWLSFPPQQYLLTLGFKNKEDGNFLEKISSRKLPTFTDHKTPFSRLTREDNVRHMETMGKRILPILDFIKGTRLNGGLCACSGVMEKLQYASLLSQLQRVKEQSQVINQAMAELATIPYLQDISQQEAELLQLLMADAMDTLEGRRSNKERVWNTIQKVGQIENFLYQLEDSFLKTKKLRNARRQKTKLKRLQNLQQS
ncbi:spermatogenesis-associated protein 16 isoform X2 [Fukomys damarensis]|uniref:Spermatogenesis-associated protein 16 n=2 Tax=Fukomys damarensis TaxID=885580 RepID=A0A091DFG9_FUKDA|nr:spermatogenesis-associated protein 16 isoform X2 [Fukomys damarensis]XP_010630717.1 spermatogenesis-associated protein 16 isoform X2 [Fukomys damarensis]XP_010630718.1 spermatogenesis-associated protein 16 isoform X2 [Fukomys damarensis]KFO29807.1 Spermatogenesis-associated protein 16 [Fukomys damarensis]